MKILLIFFTLSAFAADPPKLSDATARKLVMIQRDRIALAAQAIQIQSQLKDAQTAENAAFAEASKSAGCEIDPQTVECKPKASK